jgi:SPP1 gp7 family putative phage head morphogenesis protein
MPATDEIADQLIAQDINLARLEVSEQRKVIRLLRALRAAITARLTAIDPVGVTRPTFQQARLTALLSDVEGLLRHDFRNIHRDLQQTLADVAELTGPRTAAAVNAAVGERVLTLGLSRPVLRALVDDLLIEGAPAQEWWQRQAAWVRQRFHDEMRRGITLGEGLSELKTRVRGLMDTEEHSAERIVRTSLESINNIAREHLYRANARAVRGVQWITALDTLVCVICAPLSGKVWSVPDHRPLGHNKPFPGVLAHWSCRCTQIPVVRGQSATLDQTFEQWLRKQSDSNQRKVLGTTRFELWQAGKIRLTQLTDQRHRPLTIAQLKDVA